MTREVLYTGCTIATMQAGMLDYGLIEDGAIALIDGRVAWVGEAKHLPPEYRAMASESLGGRLVTPALIDCHTHLVFGGDRAREFEMRLKGASYAEISRAGGGIVSTVTATRLASDEELLACHKQRDLLFRRAY